MKYLLILFFLMPATCILLGTPLQAETAEEMNSRTGHKSEIEEKEWSIKDVTSPGSAVIDRSHFVGSLKMSFIFLIVFGGVACYFNKYKVSFKSSYNAQSSLSISEEKNLGNGTSLLLLKVFDEYVLLSKHAGKVELLKSFSSKEIQTKLEGLPSKANHQSKQSDLIQIVTSSPEKTAHAIS
jgi:flagellar biogenesis protein FliO